MNFYENCLAIGFCKFIYLAAFAKKEKYYF